MEGHTDGGGVGDDNANGRRHILIREVKAQVTKLNLVSLYLNDDDNGDYTGNWGVHQHKVFLQGLCSNAQYTGKLS